jgi:hypothetical protein
MKVANMSMAARVRRARLMAARTRRARLGLLVAALAALSAGSTVAQVSPRSAVLRAQQHPKVVSKARQPVGTPHKVSSFAPHPTKRRVFGAPIQPPIVSKVPPK